MLAFAATVNKGEYVNFYLKMHQNAFTSGPCPDLLGKLTALPQANNWTKGRNKGEKRRRERGR